MNHLVTIAIFCRRFRAVAFIWQFQYPLFSSWTFLQYSVI